MEKAEMTTDQRFYLVTITNDSRVSITETVRIPRLEELQLLVGGYIEVVRTSSKLLLVVNEDGWSRRLPVTLVLPGGTMLLGPVLLLRQDREDITTMTKDEVTEALDWLKTLLDFEVN